jgi:hypothetical protein
MMREIEGVASEPRLRRRWFHDDYFDLFVWENETGDVTRFELCYGSDSAERALVWRRGAGFFHDGEQPAKAKPEAHPIVMRFEEAAQQLPENIRGTVAQRVRKYVDGKIKAASRRKRFRRDPWQNLRPELSNPKQ